MTLEEVKEHFKYAKEVRCLVGDIYDITKANSKGIFEQNGMFWFMQGNFNCLLCANGEFAPILTYIFERGEEVEVSDDCNLWEKKYFVGFTKAGLPVTESNTGYAIHWKYIRKIKLQTLLEPELSELKKKAESNGMSVTIIFDNLNK